jgi:hypothetical protein
LLFVHLVVDRRFFQKEINHLVEILDVFLNSWVRVDEMRDNVLFESVFAGFEFIALRKIHEVADVNVGQLVEKLDLFSRVQLLLQFAYREIFAGNEIKNRIPYHHFQVICSGLFYVY